MMPPQHGGASRCGPSGNPKVWKRAVIPSEYRSYNKGPPYDTAFDPFELFYKWYRVFCMRCNIQILPMLTYDRYDLSAFF